MHTKNDKDGIPLSSFEDVTDKTTARAKRMTRDSDSEEAILFERTVQVTYEDASLTNAGAPIHQPRVWAK